MTTLENIELARGLTRCAVDCFETLECLTKKQLSSLSIGILAGHCVEASMKAHLAHAGWEEDKLKKLGHDLLKCWQAAKSSHTGTTESPYQITSAVNKLQMTKCDFSPARPMVGRAASVSWEIRSGAPGALGPFRVSILAGHQPVDSFTVDAIGAGASGRRPRSPAGG